jgi:hypothetical protein
LLSDEYRGQYLVTKSGLSQDERVELQSLAPEANAAFRAELQESISNLRRLLASGDPLHIAAMIQFFNLFGAWGSYYEPTHEGSEPKVELVCGLLATQAASKDPKTPTTEEIQRILEVLDQISELVVLVNVSRAGPGADHTDMLRYMGAMHWMFMRGPSYGRHGQDLAMALYKPHDDWLLAEYGFTVGDVLKVGVAVESLVNKRANELLDRGRGFANEMVSGVRRKEVQEQLPVEIRRSLRTKKGRDHVLARAMLYVIETGIRQSLTFSIDELCTHAPALPKDRVEAVLRELSVGVGSLDAGVYTGLFDESPFVARPFLEFNGRFLFVIPGMLLRDTVAVLEDRFMTKKAGFSRARALVLDRLAVNYLASMLPGARVYTNLTYEGYELDGLVLFEDVAFVVEGKGTGLSVQGHRGDIARLQRDISRAVEDAWKQGARARDFLLRNEDAIFQHQDGSEVRVPASPVRQVIIINPTLHELAGHAPQLARLRALGLFPEGELPWSIYVNDLRVIAETAGNAAIFLHYLLWRARLPLGERITAIDEIDLWASYLLAERFAMLSDTSPGMVVVGNSSTDFDDYYNGVLGFGPEREPPRKFLEHPVTEFVERMARDRPAGWRESSGVCLDLSIPELAAVCAEATNVATKSAQASSPVRFEIGRVALIGIPPGAQLKDMLDATVDQRREATLAIYVQLRGTKPEIAWAVYSRPVSFELSDFEKAVFGLPQTSPFESVRSRTRRGGGSH